MNVKDRLAQITRQIAELEMERTRLTAAMQEPNDGAIVRWTDTQTGGMLCARREVLLWYVTGSEFSRTWDELLNLVGENRMEIADSFSTYLPASRTHTCPECGQNKPDVCRRMDPYEREINGFEQYIVMCDDCHNRRADDI